MQNHIAQFEKYLLYEKRYSIHTASSYLKDISQLADFLSLYGISEVKSITEKQIRLWIRHLISSGISNRSTNRKITSSKTFFKFLLRQKEISTSPALRIQSLKTEKKIPEFIDEKSLNILQEIHFPEDFEGIRDNLILELFYATGIRLSELTQLEIVNVDIYSCQIKVFGKRQKERIIPLLRSTKELINKYLVLRKEQLATSNKLFITNKGKEIYPKLVYRVVNKYLNLATTARKKSPHTLRHSFATHMLNKGADLNLVKEILGHSNLAATEVYTHNTFEQLKKTYKNSHPRE